MIQFDLVRVFTGHFFCYSFPAGKYHLYRMKSAVITIGWSWVRKIHLSLTGHFVQWTSSPLVDNLNSRQTFYCKLSNEYQTFHSTSVRWTLSLIYSSRNFCPARSNAFAGHFSKFAGHVRKVQRISHTLVVQSIPHHITKKKDINIFPCSCLEIYGWRLRGYPV